MANLYRITYEQQGSVHSREPLPADRVSGCWETYCVTPGDKVIIENLGGTPALLPIGTEVTVRKKDYTGLGQDEVWDGRIVGYDDDRTKYKVRRYVYGRGPGWALATSTDWAFQSEVTEAAGGWQ